MTWKSTALAGIGLLATSWFRTGASPPGPAPAPEISRPVISAEASAEVQRQAERLHRRVQPGARYEPPSRNPFRFVSPGIAATRRATADREPAPSVAGEPHAVALPPALELAGIAARIADGVTRRTAILSTSSGVLLVQEGDQVEGGYRVVTVEDESVDLMSETGAIRRLTFGASAAPSRPEPSTPASASPPPSS